MEEIFLKIRETVRYVEKYPGMFILVKSEDRNFTDFATFWTGYFIGLQHGTNIDLNLELIEWIQLRRKQRSSLFWTGYIYHILANEDDKKACKIIFKILKEFLDYYESKLKEEKKIE